MRTYVPKKDVVKIFDEFIYIIIAPFLKGAVEQFPLSDILKVMIKKVLAKQSRREISLFTGE